MTRWTAITAPDPVPWHPDEYDIRFERSGTGPCNVHVIIESGTTMLRKHPTIHTPCPNSGDYKVYANGVLLSSRRSCVTHLMPDHWLPHAHYAKGIRPRHRRSLLTHRW